MRASAEPLDGNKVKLQIEVDESELEPEIDKAFKKIAQQVRIPGFRPGKAPRRIIEANIGVEAARAQALNDALPGFYAKALDETDTDAIASPEIEITKGQQEGPVTFEAEVEVRPVPDIDGYNNLKVEVPSPTVGDGEVDAEIEKLRMQFADMEEVERAAKPGDFVTIDLAGTSDGEPVPGLTANDYSYEVGNVMASLGDDFDGQVEGSSAGDVKEFDSTIPPNDQEVSFRVEVKAVNERKLPEVTDEWAKEASEFETVEALRTDIKERLQESRAEESARQLRNGSIKAVADLVQIEVPTALVEPEMQRQVQDLAQRLGQQGIQLDQFLQLTGQNQEEFVEQLRGNATDSVRADLALRAVAELENMQVTDEDVTREIELLARQFQQDAETIRHDLEHADQMPAVRSDIRKAKAVRWLMDHVEIVDSDGNPVDRSEIRTEAEEDDVQGEVTA
jgi:trigger factor